MNFKVIKTGGKQYKVKSGDSLKIEKLAGEHKVGSKVVFGEVLLIDNGETTEVGTPLIEGEKAEATISEIGRNRKIDVIKYKQKSRYYKKNGHRQPFMKVKITD